MFILRKINLCEAVRFSKFSDPTICYDKVSLPISFSLWSIVECNQCQEVYVFY